MSTLDQEPVTKARGDVLDILMLASIVYLVGGAISGTDAPARTLVEVFLALSFARAGFFRRHLFGIDRAGLPRPEDLDCAAMETESCRASCEELKKSLTHLEHSGALRSRKRSVWRFVGYGFGLGGILLALLTSSGLLAALGVALSLPSVLDWLKDDPDAWAHWQGLADELRCRLQAFAEECVERRPAEASSAAASPELTRGARQPEPESPR